MSSLISVDFDFLVPHGMYDVIPMPDGRLAPGMLIFDWQMNESRSEDFDDILWRGRVADFMRWGLDIVTMTTPPVSPVDFITEISCKIDGNSLPAWRGDSHAWGGIVARDYAERFGPLDVINFDAHHDLGYEPYPLAGYRETGRIGCDDWALIGLYEGWIKNYTIVYPDWLGMNEYGSPGRYRANRQFPGRIKAMTWSKFLAKGEIVDAEVAYFCRSSAWIPPWLDPEFQKLHEEWGYVECIDCAIEQSNTPFDTCKQRPWDWSAVKKEVKLREEAFKYLESLQTGT